MVIALTLLVQRDFASGARKSGMGSTNRSARAKCRGPKTLDSDRLWGHGLGALPDDDSVLPSSPASAGGIMEGAVQE